jgi:hypothetical protein
MRRTSIFVGSAFVAQYPEGGGNFWVPLQYLLGLRALGVDAYWIELLWTQGSEARDRDCVEAFLAHCAMLGVCDRVILLHATKGTPPQAPERIVWHGMPERALRARARDGVLLNLADSIGPWLRAAFGRTVLVDLDPGLFQIWAREYDLGVGTHDVHVTIGRNLGTPDCRVPGDGVGWRAVWPPVHVAAWADSGPPGASYTTVTQCWSREYAFLDGEAFDCNKRSSFIDMAELPVRVPVPCELAANITPGETEDQELLRRHRWRLADPGRVAGTPMAYRRYVQSSRGEFSCAKPGYVKARPGFISDRTLCYLASGRPCVVQSTGAESWLPESRGLRFFRTLDEAVDGLCEIEADYAAAARAARTLAHEVFDTRVTIPALLRAAGD